MRQDSSSFREKGMLIEPDFIEFDPDLATIQAQEKENLKNKILKKPKNNIQQFLSIAAENPKVFNMITDEAQRRGYFEEEVCLPRYKQKFDYYDKKIRPYQSIDALPKRVKMKNIYNDFVNIEDLKEHSQKKKVEDYLRQMETPQEKATRERKEQIMRDSMNLEELNKQLFEDLGADGFTDQPCNASVDQRSRLISMEVESLRRKPTQKSKNSFKKHNFGSIKVASSSSLDVFSNSPGIVSNQSFQRFNFQNRKASYANEYGLSPPTLISRQQASFLPSIVSGIKGGVSHPIQELTNDRSQICIRPTNIAESTSKLKITLKPSEQFQRQRTEVSHLPTGNSRGLKGLLKRAVTNTNTFIIDKNSPALQNQFKILSSEKKLDKAKLKKFCAEEFNQLGPMVYRICKKPFHSFSIPIDYNMFCECIEKMLNFSVDLYKKVYFKLLDVNKDDRLCDSDLFRLLQLMKDNKLFEMLNEDLCRITKELEKKRQNRGKCDTLRMSKDTLKSNLEEARMKRKALDSVDPVEKAKDYFNTLKIKQKKFREGAEAFNSDEERQEETENIQLFDRNLSKVEQRQQRIKLMKKDINQTTFQDYLMDKVDKQRESLTVDEFLEIHFPCHGVPSPLIQILSKLTTQPLDQILSRRSKPNQNQKSKKKRSSQAVQAQEVPGEESHKDAMELIGLKNRMKQLDFDKYENLFRDLASNPTANHDYELRANKKSLSLGIAKYYGGLPNPQLVNLIFNYFSKGLQNFEIKYVDFLYYFIVEIQLDQTRMNHLVFKMIDCNQDGELSVVELMRTYLSLPASSPFAQELRIILRYYIEKNLRPSNKFKIKVDYNFVLFKQLVPLSCLARELKERFVDFSSTAHEGRSSRQHAGVYNQIIVNDRSSVLFGAESDGLQGNERVTDSEIRKFGALFGEKLSSLNVEEMFQKFVGS